jgi:hypothetical protein
MPCGCVLLAFAGLSIPNGLPRTIELEINRWENTSWGFHAINRSQVRCTVAVSGDGSRSNSCHAKLFRHYLVPDGRWRWHSIYLVPQNTAFQIDHERREFSGGPCACTWTSERLRIGDHECRETAMQWSSSVKRSGSGSIAGHKVICYRDADETGRVQEVALAPALGCELMEETTTYAGTLGIPGARSHFRVKSYVAGEPTRSLFVLPSGYSHTSENHWR